MVGTLWEVSERGGFLARSFSSKEDAEQYVERLKQEQPNRCYDIVAYRVPLESDLAETRCTPEWGQCLTSGKARRVTVIFEDSAERHLGVATIEEIQEVLKANSFSQLSASAKNCSAGPIGFNAAIVNVSIEMVSRRLTSEE